MRVKDLARRYDFNHWEEKVNHERKKEMQPSWNPGHIVYPGVPLQGKGEDPFPISTASDQFLAFKNCRWLCDAAHMDDAVKAQFTTQSNGPILPPTEVCLQLPASM